MLDLGRHLDRVLEVDGEQGTALVEPGAVHATLQRRAVEVGRRFGPDPSTHTRCTVGGMIGNNACGSRALGYGRTSDNVEGPGCSPQRARCSGPTPLHPPSPTPSAGWSRPTWRRSAPASAGSPARSRATRSSTSCPRTDAGWTGSSSGPRGRWRSCWRPGSAWSRTPRPARSPSSATPTWPVPRTPSRPCWRTRSWPARAWTTVWWRWCGAGPGRRPGPAGGGRMAVRRGHR